MVYNWGKNFDKILKAALTQAKPKNPCKINLKIKLRVVESTPVRMRLCFHNVAYIYV